MPKEFVYESKEPKIGITLPPNAKVDIYYAVEDEATGKRSDWTLLASDLSVFKVTNAQIESLSADKITTGTLDA
ncbi:MAG: hypothetical protein ACP5PP_08840, partial [Fervidobacterium sp.]